MQQAVSNTAPTDSKNHAGLDQPLDRIVELAPVVVDQRQVERADGDHAGLLAGQQLAAGIAQELGGPVEVAHVVGDHATGEPGEHATALGEPSGLTPRQFGLEDVGRLGEAALGPDRARRIDHSGPGHTEARHGHRRLRSAGHAEEATGLVRAPWLAHRGVVDALATTGLRCPRPLWHTSRVPDRTTAARTHDNRGNPRVDRRGARPSALSLRPIGRIRTDRRLLRQRR